MNRSKILVRGCLIFVVPEGPFLTSSILRDFIVFHTNEENKSFKVFKIEGIVKPIYKIMPGVLNFGIVRTEELPIQEKVFIEKWDEKMQITFNAYKGNLPLSILKIKPNKDKNVVNIVLDKSNFIGPINGEIKFSFGQKNNYSIVIPILGKIIGDIYSQPEEINFLHSQDLNIKSELTILISVRKNNQNQYKIKNISLKPSELKNFILVEKGKRLYEIKVKLLKPSFLKREGICIVSIEGKDKIYHLIIPIFLFHISKELFKIEDPNEYNKKTV